MGPAQMKTLSDARKLFLSRGIRGLVSIALASYLTGLGFSPFEIASDALRRQRGNTQEDD